MVKILLLIFDALLKVKKQMQFRPGRLFVSFTWIHTFVHAFLVRAAKTSCHLYMAKSLWLCEIGSLMYEAMFS